MAMTLKVAASRRDWFRVVGLGLAGASSCGWLEALAAEVANHPQRNKSVILLWMNGGPATIDLWDLKPGHENGGTFSQIDTTAPGVQISEHLPKLAARGKHLALVRSMSTKEGDHGRASYVAHTGVPPQGAIRFPTFGSLVAKELGDAATELRPAVCIAPRRNPDLDAHSAGFLGSEYAPLLIGENGTYNNPGADPERLLYVANLSRPGTVGDEQFARRVALARKADGLFAGTRPDDATAGHRAAFGRAVRLMDDRASRTFNLADETAAARDAYGRTVFGQGCLLARRLVERGVPFVEVALDGWDTHQNNFDQVAALAHTLDDGWSALLDDLSNRGLLDSTLVIGMGEFGRTPKINGNAGRDHYPAAWSVAMTGGGVLGGTVVGRTSADGTTVEERPVTIPDLLATICRAAGIDPLKQNLSNVNRPIRIVDKTARPIEELL
ncbi:MAG: DUF1501 domain-containing protein [Planctomycetia bacterium]|nr:DUF1501 domain-containing protein [Planctomycetia bacterium]